jgi:hypothetical protein
MHVYYINLVDHQHPLTYFFQSKKHTMWCAMQYTLICKPSIMEGLLYKNCATNYVFCKLIITNGERNPFMVLWMFVKGEAAAIMLVCRNIRKMFNKNKN